MIDRLPPEILEVILKHLGPLTILTLKSVSKRMRKVIIDLRIKGKTKLVEGKFFVCSFFHEFSTVQRMSIDKWLIITSRSLMIYDNLVKNPMPTFTKLFPNSSIFPKKVAHSESFFAYLEAKDSKDFYVSVWDHFQNYQNVANLKIPIDNLNQYNYGLVMLPFQIWTRKKKVAKRATTMIAKKSMSA